MRDFFQWMKGRGFWKKSHSAHRSVRRSAIAWGSAIALATGSVAAWGAASPTTEQNAAGSSASQAQNDGHSTATEDARWHDGARGHDELQGGDTSTDDGTSNGTPATDDGTPATDDGTSGTADGDQNAHTGSDQDAQHEAPGATTPAPTPTDPAPAPGATPSSGWPTAATTGVPAGVTLTQMNGLTVTTNGAVIDAKLVKGDIIIKANNVTIKNSKVEGRIQVRPPYTGLMVQRTEIAGPGTAWAAVTEGIGYANFTCDGCNIHGWGKGAMLDANVTISKSWIHDMPVTSESHNEAILSLGGPNYTIVGNRLDSGSAGNFTASLAFLNQWNSFTNTLVQGNLFNGGGYCVYAGGEAAHNDQYPSSDVRFLDNTFGTAANPKCGYYGAGIAWDASGPGNQWSGNVMSTGGEVRAPSAG